MLSKDLYEELAKRLKRFNFSLDMLKTELLTIYGKEEAKAIVDMYLDVLQYTKEQIDGRGLDIYSSRGKKNE